MSLSFYWLGATLYLSQRRAGDIARAKGMSQAFRDAGLGRESLYKALSPTGNPEFATILKVTTALGLQLYGYVSQLMTCWACRRQFTLQAGLRGSYFPLVGLKRRDCATDLGRSTLR